MTTTADTHTFFQNLTKAGLDKEAAEVIIRHEVAKNEEVLTPKDGEIIATKMSAMEDKMDARTEVMEAKMEAMEARIMAGISDSKKSVYQAVAIGTGLILATVGIGVTILIFVLGNILGK